MKIYAGLKAAAAAALCEDVSPATLFLVDFYVSYLSRFDLSNTSPWVTLNFSNNKLYQRARKIAHMTFH